MNNGEASVDVNVDPDELAEVEAALRAIGFDGPVTPSIAFRSLGTLPWVLMFSLPVTAFLTSFFGAVGNDAWKAFKNFVTRVQRARPNRQGSIEFRSHNSSPSLTIPEGLPDEAYRALFDLDFDAFEGSAVIYWDAERSEWTD